MIDNADTLNWIPEVLPAGLQLIVSCRTGSGAAAVAKRREFALFEVNVWHCWLALW